MQTDASVRAQATLVQGLRSLGVYQDLLVARLSRFEELLVRWNKTFNLISAKTEANVMPVHVLDCLSAIPYLKESRVLDIGTGAGLPGLVLAMARTDWEFVLVDAVRKKIRFCQEVVADLGLDNVELHHCRIEDYVASRPFATITSRAFASWSTFVCLAGANAVGGTRLIAFKGKVDAELDGVGAMGDNTQIVPLTVPGLSAERHLLMMDWPDPRA